MRRIEKYFNDEEDIEKMTIENIFNILYTFEYTEFDLNLFSWSSKIITIEVRNEDYNNKKVYDYIINNYTSAVYRYIAEYNRHNMNIKEDFGFERITYLDSNFYMRCSIREIKDYYKNVYSNFSDLQCNFISSTFLYHIDDKYNVPCIYIHSYYFFGFLKEFERYIELKNINIKDKMLYNIFKDEAYLEYKNENKTYQDLL